MKSNNAISSSVWRRYSFLSVLERRAGSLNKNERGASNAEYSVILSLGLVVATAVVSNAGVQSGRTFFHVAGAIGGGTETVIAGGTECWRIQDTLICYIAREDNSPYFQYIPPTYDPLSGTVNWDVPGNTQPGAGPVTNADGNYQNVGPRVGN